MSESVILGSENAVRESGVTVRKNHTTATPSEQPGYPATNVLDELIGAPTRGATADVGYTTHLVRLAGDRLICGGALIGHNLSPKAQVRFTADDEACRPGWRADGVDDVAITAETIPTPTDMSMFWYGYIPPPGISHDASAVPGFFRLRNAASGTRVRVAIRSASSGSSEFHLSCLTFNFTGSNTQIISMSPIALGSWHLIGYRYRASDDRCELWINGVFQGSETAPAKVVGTEGDVFLEMSKWLSVYTPGIHRDWVCYSEYASDAKMADTTPPVVLGGTERNLVESFHFTEGVGNSVAGSTGVSTLTLTGGSWADYANPSPRHSTGILEAIGQWYRRSALRISTGTSVATTSAIATAPRDLTMSCLLEVLDDFPGGTDTEVFAYGPTYANGEGIFSIDSSGQIVITSNRGTPDTVTSSTIRGSGVVRARLVLQSVDNTTSNLSLYLGTGTAAESLVGTVQVGPYDAVASCKVLIGDVGAGSDNSHVRISDARVFGAVRLEADDDLLAPCDLSDPSLIESLRLDGDVASDIVPARAYTTNSLTYETIQNPNPKRLAPGRDGLGFPRAGAIQDQINRIVWKIDAADVEVSEIFVEIWDPLNSDGYVEIGAILAWSSFRPRLNRVHGAPRSYRKPLSERMPSGHPMLLDGYSADGVAVRLKHLDHLATDEQLSEADELARRLQRLRSDLLVLVVWDPQAPQWLLPERSVVGTVSKIRDIEDTDNFYADTEIQFEGVL